MGRLLILIGIVLAVLWFLHWFRVTPPEQVSRVLRKVALWGVIGLVLLAVLTGRLNPLFAALGALIPIVLRVAHLLRLAPALQQLIRALGLGGLAGAAHAGQQASAIRTRYLSMRLDHATGALDGSVLDGPFKGRQLGELDLDDLLRMLELYRDSDAQSAAVLESYLDREHGDDWRDRVSNHAQAGQAPPSSGRLSDAEARSILGVDANANAEAIRAAHRRLMQRLHPDRGGSDYLAAQINAAKRTLLGE
ncbi:molecular chaperone DnaJ [Thiocystis minor]|uniref:molecular chaperone DnaJ n=1 Tax=Thiocystis minor TaxID=61597 RepID=UPI001913EB94|nr:molecular chaperone DnaJ [Thiocystis minor]MBK5965392.1 molecular chaperone DnaJ [Thiocystis minor]